MSTFKKNTPLGEFIFRIISTFVMLFISLSVLNYIGIFDDTYISQVAYEQFAILSLIVVCGLWFGYQQYNNGSDVVAFCLYVFSLVIIIGILMRFIIGLQVSGINVESRYMSYFGPMEVVFFSFEPWYVHVFDIAMPISIIVGIGILIDRGYFAYILLSFIGALFVFLTPSITEGIGPYFEMSTHSQWSWGTGIIVIGEGVTFTMNMYVILVSLIISDKIIA